jgi:uncharacterized protein (DUF1697 family)
MAKKRPMTRYIAFLRGINVGGHRVKMEQLRELFEGLKLTNVSTFIASGNVIFDTADSNSAAIEQRIEAHLHEVLGYAVDTFVRTPFDLAAVAAFRPFATEEIDAPGHTLYVAFLRNALDEANARKLMSFRTTFDDFRVEGRELYWLCRGKMTDSLVSWPQLTKAIATCSTARNVTTVRKLVALHPAG